MPTEDHVERAPWQPGSGSGFGGPAHPCHQPRLAPGGGVPVEDALLSRHVDSFDRYPQRVVFTVGTGGSLRSFLSGLELSSNGAIAETTLLVLPVALDLRLDVGH